MSSTHFSSQGTGYSGPLVVQFGNYDTSPQQQKPTLCKDPLQSRAKSVKVMTNTTNHRNVQIPGTSLSLHDFTAKSFSKGERNEVLASRATEVMEINYLQSLLNVVGMPQVQNPLSRSLSLFSPLCGEAGFLLRLIPGTLCMFGLCNFP